MAVSTKDNIKKFSELSDKQKRLPVAELKAKSNRYASQEMFLVDKNKLAYGKGAKARRFNGLSIKFQNKRNW